MQQVSVACPRYQKALHPTWALPDPCPPPASIRPPPPYLQEPCPWLGPLQSCQCPHTAVPHVDPLLCLLQGQAGSINSSEHASWHNGYLKTSLVGATVHQNKKSVQFYSPVRTRAVRQRSTRTQHGAEQLLPSRPLDYSWLMAAVCKLSLRVSYWFGCCTCSASLLPTPAPPGCTGAL
jgi:hypothetical protein